MQRTDAPPTCRRIMSVRTAHRDQDRQEGGRIMTFRQWIKKPESITATALVSLSAAVIIGVSVNAPDPAPVKQSAPANLCREEDGSDQEFCWWCDKGTGWILNIDRKSTRLNSSHTDIYRIPS